MFHYQGKTASIAGASAGIGRAFAQELAKRGMSVILVARSSEQLYSLESDLHQTHDIRAEVAIAKFLDIMLVQSDIQKVLTKHQVL